MENCVQLAIYFCNGLINPFILRLHILLFAPLSIHTADEMAIRWTRARPENSPYSPRDGRK